MSNTVRGQFKGSTLILYLKRIKIKNASKSVD